MIFELYMARGKSMQTDQEDRYISDKPKSKPLLSSSVSQLSKRKLVILILLLFILLLLISFAIFKPNESSDDLAKNETQTSQDSTETGLQYQQITRSEISTDATETLNGNGADKQRLEIPGEVTDLIADKIMELDKESSSNVSIPVQIKATERSVDPTFNELVLNKNIEAHHYSIQISASSSLDNLLLFVKQHQLSNYQIYETVRDQKPWFILIKGNYPTRDDAKAALQALPDTLQKNSPWIKSGATINKEKQPI